MGRRRLSQLIAGQSSVAGGGESRRGSAPLSTSPCATRNQLGEAEVKPWSNTASLGASGEPQRVSERCAMADPDAKDSETATVLGDEVRMQ